MRRVERNGVHAVDGFEPPDSGWLSQLPPRARWAVLGAMALAAATAWLDRRISSAVEPVAAQVSPVDRDVGRLQADLAAHYAVDARNDQSLTDLGARVTRIESAVDLANHDPQHDQGER